MNAVSFPPPRLSQVFKARRRSCLQKRALKKGVKEARAGEKSREAKKRVDAASRFSKRFEEAGNHDAETEVEPNTDNRHRGRSTLFAGPVYTPNAQNGLSLLSASLRDSFLCLRLLLSLSPACALARSPSADTVGTLDVCACLGSLFSRPLDSVFLRLGPGVRKVLQMKKYLATQRSLLQSTEWQRRTV